MRKVDLVTWCLLAAIGPVIWLTLMVLDGCSLAAERETKLTVDDTSHKALLDACTLDAKKQPEGKQFVYFCECWVFTNARFHVDAGACTR